MKQITSVLLLLILGCYATAQNGKPQSFAWVGKWAPLSLIDPNAPTFQPGVGLTWNKRWGVHAEYGFHFNPFNLVRISNKDQMQTNRLRAELRYYPEKPNNRDQYGSFFMAAEGFRVEQSYRRLEGRFFIPHSGQEFLFDTATVHRHIKGLVLKGGYELFLGKRKKLLLEASGGAGLRRITNQHTHVKNILQQQGDFINGFMDAFRVRRNDEWEGSKTRPHLSFTVRLGYRIL